MRKVEEALWRDRGDVDLLYVPLKEYLARLEASSSRRDLPHDATTSGRPDGRRRRTSASSPTARSDADFFFGRDDEKRIVGGNLRASRLTLFYGESEVGKTSLLRAGVIHDLEHAARESGRRAWSAPLSPSASFAAWRDDPLQA